MSRTVKGKKPVGYDYWSRRPYSGASPGKKVKQLTHRVERKQSKRLAKKEEDDET